MRRAPWLTGLLALGFATLVAVPASTTVLQHFDVERLSAVATIIAVGEVGSVDARWNEPHTKIYTRVSVNPTEVLKGGRDLGPLTIKMIGGQVGGDAASLPGTPVFVRGERVLVFLEPREDGDGYHIVGLFQGVFRLRRDERGDEQLYQDPQPRDVTVVDDGGGRAATRMVTLEDVRAIVKGGRP